MQFYVGVSFVFMRHYLTTMSAGLTTQCRIVKENMWKEVVALKVMLIIPQKCKYNIYFGKEIKKKEVNFVTTCIG